MVALVPKGVGRVWTMSSYSVPSRVARARVVSARPASAAPLAASPKNSKSLRVSASWYSLGDGIDAEEEVVDPVADGDHVLLRLDAHVRRALARGQGEDVGKDRLRLASSHTGLEL